MSESERETFTLTRDGFGRLRVEVDPQLSISLKMLAEDNPQRVEFGILAYVIVDIKVPALGGVWRTRNIRIVPRRDGGGYNIRYYRWRTGVMRDGEEEWLDVAGPLGGDTRRRLRRIILDIFHQAREEAANGTLVGNRSPRRPHHGRLGDDPKQAAKLEELRQALEKAEHPEQEQAEEASEGE